LLGGGDQRTALVLERHALRDRRHRRSRPQRDSLSRTARAETPVKRSRAWSYRDPARWRFGFVSPAAIPWRRSSASCLRGSGRGWTGIAALKVAPHDSLRSRSAPCSGPLRRAPRSQISVLGYRGLVTPAELAAAAADARRSAATAYLAAADPSLRAVSTPLAEEEPALRERSVARHGDLWHPRITRPVARAALSGPAGGSAALFT
jgi:hypothetical protein